MEYSNASPRRSLLLEYRTVSQYSRIASTKSPSLCKTSAGLINLTALLPQSCGYSCYVSRPILATPPPWLQKHTGLRAYEFARTPELRHQPAPEAEDIVKLLRWLWKDGEWCLQVTATYSNQAYVHRCSRCCHSCLAWIFHCAREVQLLRWHFVIEAA